jgi:hypothetical protein
MSFGKCTGFKSLLMKGCFVLSIIKRFPLHLTMFVVVISDIFSMFYDVVVFCRRQAFALGSFNEFIIFLTNYSTLTLRKSKIK